MDYNWTLLIHLGILSSALLLASAIRSKVSFFQKFLIPNALTAGFILLVFYNFIAPKFALGTDSLGQLVYHLLNLSFIAMTLRKSPKATQAMKKRIFPTSIGVLSQYAIQCVGGLLIVALLINTIMPDLFPAIGFALPLGFVLGPGQAYTIGTGWEALGFDGAGSTGLTFAAIGFLWGCFGGIFLINLGLKRHWISEEEVEKIRNKDTSSGIFGRDKKRPAAGHLSTESEAIDSMTFNMAFVFAVYLLAYGLLHLLTLLLSVFGNLGNELATNLWGINFIFSALTALLVKALLGKTNLQYVVDNGTMTRISGISVDIMVTASIAAISLVVVAHYWLPILILTTFGGISAYFTLPWICSRMFVDHQFHRSLIIFGASTGTMPTGLALLRVIDPEFETPVASDYMYSSGLTFVFAIPLILSINLPAYSVSRDNPGLFWLALLICLAYVLFVVISFFVISRKRGIAQPGRRWYRHGMSEE